MIDVELCGAPYFVGCEDQDLLGCCVAKYYVDGGTLSDIDPCLEDHSMPRLNAVISTAKPCMRPLQSNCAEGQIRNRTANGKSIRSQ